MATPDVPTLRRSTVAAVALTSAALLMTELALTRIFSVTMYYHFAFLAISIALFGLSASGVYVFVARRWLLAREPSGLLAGHALAFAAVTVLALALLVRIRVGLNYSPQNLRLMLAIYALAALPFFAGGAVVSLALTRFAAGGERGVCGRSGRRRGRMPAADTAAQHRRRARRGAGRVADGWRWLPSCSRRRAGARGRVWLPPCSRASPPGCNSRARRRSTSGTRRDTRAIASSSAAGTRSRASRVYDRGHGDWSMSPRYTGPRPDSRFMDIDSAASTPIVRFDGDLRG